MHGCERLRKSTINIINIITQRNLLLRDKNNNTDKFIYNSNPNFVGKLKRY